MTRHALNKLAAAQADKLGLLPKFPPRVYFLMGFMRGARAAKRFIGTKRQTK